MYNSTTPFLKDIKNNVTLPYGNDPNKLFSGVINTTKKPVVTQTNTKNQSVGYSGSSYQAPKTLTQQQINELNNAYNRGGGQTATDKANIDYAMKNYGWKPPTNPVQSTDPIIKDEIDIRNKATSDLNQMRSSDPYLQAMYDSINQFDVNSIVNQGQSNIKELEDAARRLGIFSPDEEAQIKAAGENALAEFTPILNEAMEAKRQGMPKATISGGERGGFMNTQIAGAAAMPEQLAEGAIEQLRKLGYDVQDQRPGDWAGKGGELERVKSVYDNNISQIKAKAQQAKIAAEAAARTAIRTGKQSDYDILSDLKEKALSYSKMALDLNNEKISVLSNFEKITQARTTFGNTQQDRILAQIVPAITPMLTGDEETDMGTVKEFADKYGLDINALLGAINTYGTDSEELNDYPSSYQEWNLAGGESGTGKTYADWINKTKDDSDSSASSYQAERALRTIQSVDSLTKLAEANPEIFGRSAAIPIPESMRSDAYRNFKSQLDTLISNITFGELTAMREASKTGGALGQVSDNEGRLLGSSLGALSMTQTPETFKQQLQQIKDSIQRWQQAVNQYGVTGGLNYNNQQDGQSGSDLDSIWNQ